jgi:putative addiction module component (TIGR02574 family)
MCVKAFFAAAKKLPFEERVELAHRLWDEFMDGFQGWKAPPMPDGIFAWKTLKAKIDARLNKADRIKLAQEGWANVQENGYDPELTPEQIAELERRAEELRKNPQLGIPWEEAKARIEAQLAARRKNPACRGERAE